MHAGTLAALRASILKPEWERPHQHIPLGMAEVDLYLKGGVQRGALHEIHAVSSHEAAATGFAAALATRIAETRRVLWIRQDFAAAEFGDLAATGLLEFGFDPSRLFVLCVASATDGLRAAGDALSCAALGAVVLEVLGKPKVLDLMASRRLTLACASQNVTLLLLRFTAEPDASSAETRWLVSGAASLEHENWGYPVFAAELLRNRSGQTGKWIMEWNCDERIFRKPAAHSGPVVSISADQPPATPNARR